MGKVSWLDEHPYEILTLDPDTEAGIVDNL